MLTKRKLKEIFSKDWRRFYQVELFKQLGFERKRCTCGKFFWTLDPDRKICGDSSCESYNFIGRKITKRRLDYIQTWKVFESFFKKNGHISIKRYPVVDRWRPDLYFTIASIQDFQRIDNGILAWEYPADPLIVPQVCLRFSDIPNVGITGRHHTSFIMSGQHSFGSYWKDRCIELNFKFLNKELGIDAEDIVYIEDVWAMPDFSEFGPSMETVCRGLELVNSVFTEFRADGKGFKELEKKVIDVGWGHERLVWISNSTPTGYDAVFGPVIDWMKKRSAIQKSEIFERYAALAGSLDFDEVKNISEAKKELARKLGIDLKTLHAIIEPMQALYAIADHVKTLLFAIADGAIPSNVGGGYNLRVILRRALSFLNEFNFDFDLSEIAERHAKYLKPLFPELQDSLNSFAEIMEIERARYQQTLNRAKQIALKALKEGITTDRLITLYTSHGITPEIIEKVAKKERIAFSVPEDFYVKLTQTHCTAKKEEQKMNIDVSGLKTEALYYQKPDECEFEAKILKRIGDWIVLDRTLFYPEGGGQPADAGVLIAEGKEYVVEDVKKIGNAILHKVKGLKAEKVRGRIDMKRRKILSKMHTTTHIIAGITRKIFGKHIWQAGAAKGIESSRLDVTHFKAFSFDELKRIEKMANDVVSKALNVEIEILPRTEAEQKYGFIIYQGGASPGKEVRIVKIPEIDVEACGGMHVRNTSEIGIIKILKTERVQDGVNRLVFTCAEPALKWIENRKKIFAKCLKQFMALPANEQIKKRFLKQKFDEYALYKASLNLSVDPEQLPLTIKKFCEQLLKENELINEFRKRMHMEEVLLDVSDILTNLPDASKKLFEMWKEQRKELEKLREEYAKSCLESLLQKEKDETILDVVFGDRQFLINLASKVLDINPNLTVVLANQSGDIVVMSKKRNAVNILRQICSKASGRGGGTSDIAQGKIDISKFLKIKAL